VRSKTVSLWSYINSNLNEFRNSAYEEYDGVVECSTAFSSLQLWTNYYFQYKDVIDDSLVDAFTINSRQNPISHSNNNRPPNAAGPTFTSVSFLVFFLSLLDSIQ
jgi:hypothetical protein